MTNDRRRLAHNKRIRDWVAANPERRSEINRKYYQANREAVLLAQKIRKING